MKATKVDKDLCIGCGLCCGICDEVFRMNEMERRKRINEQTLKIKVLYRRPSTRVLCLQSPGKINSNASICFFD